MYRITLDINQSIYDKVIFFLNNIPKNLIKIKQERVDEKKEVSNSISTLKQLQGVGKELYKDIDSDQYIKELRDEWSK